MPHQARWRDPKEVKLLTHMGDESASIPNLPAYAPRCGAHTSRRPTDGSPRGLCPLETRILVPKEAVQQGERGALERSRRLVWRRTLTRDDVPREEQNNGDPEGAAITVLAPSVRDATLAPPGKGTLVVYVEAEMEYGENSEQLDPVYNEIAIVCNILSMAHL